MADRQTNLQRAFDRRQDAAIQGLHLPSAEDLLCGMKFFKGRIGEDIREFAGRLSRRVKKRNRLELVGLAQCLDELAVEHTDVALLDLENWLGKFDEIAGLPIDEARVRCAFYRAHLGDATAASIVAAEMAALALVDAKRVRNPVLLWRSLSWATHGRRLRQLQDSGFVAHNRVWTREVESYEAQFKDLICSKDDPEPEKQKERASSNNRIAEATEEDKQTEKSAKSNSDGVIVVRSIGNEGTSEGKQIKRDFEKVLNCPLPLPATGDLGVLRRVLVDEFPYANRVVDEILKGLVGRKQAYIRPTVLVGSPGCGKTRFARRLAEELGTPYELISCGGLFDSAIGGTPRRWSTGEPSLAVMAVRRHHCAGPMIILDEIEKVGTSRQNGAVHDVLVGLLERETASRWHDPYVHSHCDLSHVSWLMTANSIDPIPGVLRDRCRVMHFPEPGPEMLSFLVPRILERVYSEVGHHPRWPSELEEFEIEALQRAWPGGSIRVLERLVQQVIDARDQTIQRH